LISSGHRNKLATRQRSRTKEPKTFYDQRQYARS